MRGTLSGASLTSLDVCLPVTLDIALAQSRGADAELASAQTECSCRAKLSSAPHQRSAIPGKSAASKRMTVQPSSYHLASSPSALRRCFLRPSLNERFLEKRCSMGSPLVKASFKPSTLRRREGNGGGSSLSGMTGVRIARTRNARRRNERRPSEEAQ